MAPGPEGGAGGGASLMRTPSSEPTLTSAHPVARDSAAGNGRRRGRPGCRGSYRELSFLVKLRWGSTIGPRMLVARVSRQRSPDAAHISVSGFPARRRCLPSAATSPTQARHDLDPRRSRPHASNMNETRHASHHLLVTHSACNHRLPIRLARVHPGRCSCQLDLTRSIDVRDIEVVLPIPGATVDDPRSIRRYRGLEVAVCSEGPVCHLSRP